MRASVANSVITKTQITQGANQSLKEKLAATKNLKPVPSARI